MSNPEMKQRARRLPDFTHSLISANDETSSLGKSHLRAVPPENLVKKVK